MSCSKLFLILPVHTISSDASLSADKDSSFRSRSKRESKWSINKGQVIHVQAIYKSVFRHKTSFQSVSWFMKAYPVDTKAALLLIMTNWWDWVDKLLRWDQPLCDLYHNNTCLLSRRSSAWLQVEDMKSAREVHINRAKITLFLSVYYPINHDDTHKYLNLPLDQ